MIDSLFESDTDLQFETGQRTGGIQPTGATTNTSLTLLWTRYSGFLKWFIRNSDSFFYSIISNNL